MNIFRKSAYPVVNPITVYSSFFLLKGDSNPNDKYILSDRDLWTMNFDTNFYKIG